MSMHKKSNPVFILVIILLFLFLITFVLSLFLHLCLMSWNVIHFYLSFSIILYVTFMHVKTLHIVVILFCLYFQVNLQ